MGLQWQIYPFEQLDGLCSAATILRFANMKSEPAKLGGFLSYANCDSIFNEMARQSNALFFILDFPPEHINELEKKLRSITLKNRIAYWSSHHHCGEKTISLLKNFVKIVDIPASKTQVCATELACNRFMPNDVVAGALMAIASDIEFWQRQDQRAAKLNDVVAAGFDKKSLVDALSKGVFWSEKFDRLRNDYLRKKEFALAELPKRIIVKNYLGKNFGIAVAENFLGSAEAGQKLLDTATIDVSALIYRDGRLSFRRKEGCNINLKALAKIFGGGGHAYASGGSITNDFRNVSHENFEKVLFFVDRKLKDYFLG